MRSLVCSVQSKITEWKKLWNTKMKWFNSNTQLCLTTITTYTDTQTWSERKEKCDNNMHTYVRNANHHYRHHRKQTKNTHSSGHTNEIWFTCVYGCGCVYVCVHMCVFVYANELMMFWLMYAVIVVGTLHKKDIIFTETRVVVVVVVVVFFFLCTWPMNFSLWRSYNEISLYSHVGFAWLELAELAKTRSFYDFFWCYLFFFTDVEISLFFPNRVIQCTSGCLSLYLNEIIAHFILGNCFYLHSVCFHSQLCECTYAMRSKYETKQKNMKPNDDAHSPMQIEKKTETKKEAQT